MDDPFDALFRRGRSLRFAPDADTNAVAGYEGLVGNDQIAPTGWVIGNVMNLDSGATVTIDSTGITIENGAMILKDRFGATVMRAIGFDGAWNRYLQSGFYNAGFAVGDTVDIAVTEVGTGSTVADYEASLTSHLPYWVVAASGGTIKRVADVGATEGFAIQFSGTGGQVNRIYQDIVVPANRDSWSIFVDYVFSNMLNAADAIKFYASWRKSDHSIIGSRVAISQFVGALGAGSTGPYGQLFLETDGNGDGGPGIGLGIGDSPPTATYLRFEIEISHTTATFTFTAGDVFAATGVFKGEYVKAYQVDGQYLIASTLLTALDGQISNDLSVGHNLTVTGTITSGGVATELVNGATAGPDADITLDAAGAAGTASTHARSQHGHKLTTYASIPGAPTVGGSAGTSASGAARGDHLHPGVETRASMPGSPTTNQRVFRTDLGMEFYYDGTRWLSAKLFTHTIEERDVTANTTGLAATTTAVFRSGTPQLGGGSDIYLVDWEFTFDINGGTALSGSHKWDVAFKKIQADTTTTVTVVTSTINSGAANNWRRATAAINALLTQATYFNLQVDYTKTGTPGNLIAFVPRLTYRIVAT